MKHIQNRTHKNNKRITRKNKKSRKSKHIKIQRKNKKLTTKHKYRKAKSKKTLNKSKRAKKVLRKYKKRIQNGGVAHKLVQESFNDNVPYLPPGGVYKPGSDQNGLGGGYYYKLSNDIHGTRNFYEPNNKMNYSGQKGGGILPQDIVDLGRNIIYGGKSVYSGLVGENLSISSNPNVTKQNLQMTDKNVMPTNFNKIFKQSSDIVSKIQ